MHGDKLLEIILIPNFLLNRFRQLYTANDGRKRNGISTANKLNSIDKKRAFEGGYVANAFTSTIDNTIRNAANNITGQKFVDMFSRAGK